MLTHSPQRQPGISPIRLTAFSTMLLILILSISSVASAEILDDTETILACGMAESGNCGVTFLLLFILIVSAVALIKLDAYWKRNGKR